jgi:hypothetical protein
MSSSGLLRRVATGNVVPSSPILVTLIKDELRSSETLALNKSHAA